MGAALGVRRRSEAQSPLWLFALDVSSRVQPKAVTALPPRPKTQACHQAGFGKCPNSRSKPATRYLGTRVNLENGQLP
jgi:hypothetical protein